MYDYGNARLHARKSRLFSHSRLTELAEAGTVSELLSALTHTPYQTAVERASVQFTDIACLNEALRTNWLDMVGQVPQFYNGIAGQLAKWVIRRYEVDNVKTILRGLARQVPANEIIAATLPTGALSTAELAALARVANERSAIDLMATWQMPLAEPLLALRAERPGTDLFEMELALEQFYFQAAQRAANKLKGSAFGQLLQLDADINNILTVLRLVGVAEVVPFLQQRFDSDNVAVLFIGPGSLPFAKLTKAATQNSVQEAVDSLTDTQFAMTLTETAQQVAVNGRLSDFEHALRGVRLKQANRFFIQNPLGIGVLIGYIALKTAEIANLRRIAQGLQLGEPAEQIQAKLLRY